MLAPMLVVTWLIGFGWGISGMVGLVAAVVCVETRVLLRADPLPDHDPYEKAKKFVALHDAGLLPPVGVATR